MTLCVYLVIVLIVVTKLCVVAYTLQRLARPDGETNPIARQMMISVGTTKAVLIVFALVLVIISLASGAAIGAATSSMHCLSFRELGFRSFRHLCHTVTERAGTTS